MDLNFQIQLALPVVTPLVPLIREEAAALDKAAPTDPSDQLSVTPQVREEVQALIALFDRRFTETGRIAITMTNYAEVLRASAFLRLHLRRGPLAGITDADMENGIEPTTLAEPQQTSYTCALFLATLTEVILSHLPNSYLLKEYSLHPVFDPLRRLFGKTRREDTPASGPDRIWEVVVLNDPVNLMNYVTAVFQKEMGLTRDTAILRMQEVHDQKQSTVWSGSKEKAAAKMAALRRWHLRTELRPAIAS